MKSNGIFSATRFSSKCAQVRATFSFFFLTNDLLRFVNDNKFVAAIHNELIRTCSEARDSRFLLSLRICVVLAPNATYIGTEISQFIAHIMYVNYRTRPGQCMVAFSILESYIRV